MSSATTPQGSLIIPTIRYKDAPAAIDWLARAFGFEARLVVPDGAGGVAHAQLTYKNGMIMLGTASDDEFGRLQASLASTTSTVSQSAYVVVEDVDAHHAAALSAGASVVTEPIDQDHGGRYYACRDPEGNLWNFGSYDPWVPAE
jgi:uncharacterized glyoxalase superfamily protein PhnB